MFPKELNPEIRTSEPRASRLFFVRPTATLLVLLVLLTGFAYPWAITEVADALTPASAGGSLVHAPNGKVCGSSLLGQNITDPRLFWLRPSLIDDQPFTGAGGETPLGPTDPALLNETRYYIGVYGLTNVSVPFDLVSPSASGLDPDITPAAALVQIPRVALATGLPQSFLRTLVNQHIVPPVAGFLGHAYVNVIELDNALIQDFPRVFVVLPAPWATCPTP